MSLAKPKTIPTWERESGLIERGKSEGCLGAAKKQIVFGIDEAGRGCLVGPVYAAVVAWDGSDRVLEGIRDSKQLKEAQREALFQPIQDSALTFGVGFASAAEIDRYNILEATNLAATRALEAALARLDDRNNCDFSFLSDGKLPFLPRMSRFAQNPSFRQELALAKEVLCRRPLEEPIIKGDSISVSIAAASILAKVSRDHCMLELDKKFPAYRFAEHKGYVTALHQELLKAHGPIAEHRRSFGPVRDLLQNQNLFSN